MTAAVDLNVVSYVVVSLVAVDYVVQVIESVDEAMESVAVSSVVVVRHLDLVVDQLNQHRPVAS